MNYRITIASLAAVVLGCAGGAALEPTGTIRAEITASSQITRIAVTVEPAGVSQDLAFDQSTSSFSGVLVVGVGPQNVSASAYANADLVGTASASVLVSPGAVAQVKLNILDIGGVPPIPDHSPLIASLVLPESVLDVAASMTVSANATDVDADPISYSWASTPDGCGAFADSTASSTTFTAVQPGLCTIAVTALANGKSTTRTGDVVISDGTSGLDVSGTYVPQPIVTTVLIRGGCSVSRYGEDASCNVALTSGTQVEMEVWFDAGGLTPLVSVSSDCTSDVLPWGVHPAGYGFFYWTPLASGVCTVTARVSSYELEDSFPVPFLVNP